MIVKKITCKLFGKVDIAHFVTVVSPSIKICMYDVVYYDINHFAISIIRGIYVRVISDVLEFAV